MRTNAAVYAASESGFPFLGNWYRLLAPLDPEQDKQYRENESLDVFTFW